MDEKIAAAAVDSFPALHDRLSNYRAGWIFRGHAKLEWKLVPKAGRESPGRGFLFMRHEKVLFQQWKRRAVEHLGSQYGAPESDWLAIAQHHGLATRLLDWTINPLNAAYFAVREPGDGPAVIHAAKFEKWFEQRPPEELYESMDSQEAEYVDSLQDDRRPEEPFEPTDYRQGGGITILRPSGIVPRIVRQGGLFTVHGPPSKSLESFARPGIVALERILIAESYRHELLVELARYGINSSSLFPDLDGLSTYLNWTIESGGSLD